MTAEDMTRRAPAAAVDPTPHVSRRKAWFIRTFALVTLAYSIYYIAWRWTATLNPDALWFSIPLVVAETYGLLTAAVLLFTVWHLRRREPVPAPEGLSVDVYITTYDEALEIIRRTAIGAREIRYPHRTYILDDGKRDEVRALTEELGIGYIRREGNEHAKAGNLNNALKVTDGEFILQLDADHVPLPHILDRLLGFFGDEKVAFVQSPQDFYNTDSFTHEVSEGDRRIWEEQRIFFSLIQPGKDRWNAAFFCGSCGVLRRAAIEEIGGFSVETITEDMETSLILHGRGWKSVYYGESLAYGLAPGSAGAFHVQRLRWGQGSMQILRKFNPLTYPGLTLAQRICYFASVISYLDGVQKMMLYAAPLLFFLTGAFPIRTTDAEFLIRFGPYLVLTLASYELVSRGTGNLWLAERYNMAKFFTYILAVSGYFARGKLKFNVTPKGAGHVPFKTYAPQLALMVITMLSIGWAVLAYRNGWIDYRVAGWSSAAFLLNFAWAAWNFGMAAYVVRLSLYLRQQREDHRFADYIPIEIRRVGPGGHRERVAVAMTKDLNASGMAFRAVKPLPVGSRVEIQLALAHREVCVEGEVLHCRSERHGGWMHQHGLRFVDVPLNTRDAIEHHCTQHAVPLWHQQYRGPVDIFRRTSEWMNNARSERRQRVRLPAMVAVPADSAAEAPEVEQLGLLDEISTNGARLILRHPVTPGTRIQYRVPGTNVAGTGIAVDSRVLETVVGVRFVVGLDRRTQLRPEQRESKMNAFKMWKKAGATAAALVLGSVAATSAAAQVQAVGYGASEVDAQNLTLGVAGVSLQTANMGWGAVADVNALWLRFPTLGTTVAGSESLAAVTPSVGARYATPNSATQLRVGYSIVTDERPGAIGAMGGGESGVVTTLQTDRFGGVRTGGAIASYNWGSEYFWGRLRGVQQVATVGGLGLGAELAGQQGGTGEQYRAVQAGAVAEWQAAPSLRLTGVIGAKNDNRADTPNVFPYAKIEFVLVP